MRSDLTARAAMIGVEARDSPKTGGVSACSSWRDRHRRHHHRGCDRDRLDLLPPRPRV